MKKAIDFVKHAIVNRQFDEKLTMIHATKKMVQTFNGIVTCQHPVKGLDTFSMTSSSLIKALAACNYEPRIRITERSVILSKGSFKAILPYTREEVVTPLKCEGKKYPVPENFIDKIKILFPFISEDASRTWSQSILIDKGYAYVTNNIIAARIKIGDLPNLIIPIEAVAVLLKTKEIPKYLYVDTKTVIFRYDDKQMIQSRTPINDWPDIKKVFNKSKKKKAIDIPETLIKAVMQIKPFCIDDVIRIENDKLFNVQCEISDLDIKVAPVSLSHFNMERVITSFTKINFKSKPIDLYGPDGLEARMATIFDPRDEK